MQDYKIQQAQIYTDFGGLNALRAQAGQDRKAALEEVARQFEGLFMSQMLKSMRAANQVLAEGNYLNSHESGFYQDMFDSQLSLTLSRGSGLGLAEALVRQFGSQLEGDTGAQRPGSRLTLADYDRSLPPLSPRLPERVKEVDELISASAMDEAQALHSDQELRDSGEVPANDLNYNDLPARFDSPEAFVSHLLPLAREAARGTDIDPRLMVAQAALETGWGRHMIEAGDGSPSHNLFGIKADQRWHGDAVNISTSEYREGVRMTERADFRRYNNYRESFGDYVDFLHNNPRYRDALAVADQPELFAERLQQAGYATDPRYGAKIRSIMKGGTFEAVAGQDRSVVLGRRE